MGLAFPPLRGLMVGSPGQVNVEEGENGMEIGFQAHVIGMVVVVVEEKWEFG